MVWNKDSAIFDNNILVEITEGKMCYHIHPINTNNQYIRFLSLESSDGTIRTTSDLYA